MTHNPSNCLAVLIASSLIMPSPVSATPLVTVLSSTALQDAQPKNNPKLIAELSPDIGSPNKVGVGRFRISLDNAALTNNELVGDVTIPDIGLISQNFEAAIVKLKLLQVSCSLQITKIRYDYLPSNGSAKTASYELSGHRSSTGTPIYEIGNCLDNEGKSFLPQIHKNDPVSVTVAPSEGQAPLIILTGNFQ